MSNQERTPREQLEQELNNLSIWTDIDELQVENEQLKKELHFCRELLRCSDKMVTQLKKLPGKLRTFVENNLKLYGEDIFGYKRVLQELNRLEGEWKSKEK